MELINKEDGFSQSEVFLKHNGEELYWSLKFIDRTSVAKDQMFNEINAYWNSRPVAEQDEIFNVYKEIRNAFDQMHADQTILTNILKPLVAKLLDLHPMESIQHWVDFKSNIIIPNDISECYSEEENPSCTRERTYIRSDYKQLVLLAVILRTVLPIWGEYINQTQKETGTTWKEYYAFQLLSRSHLFNGFYTNDYSQPVERLRMYINGILGTEKNIPTVIFGGISSEDYPIWLLGLVIVRRVAIGDVSGTEPGPSLVRSSVYRFIIGKIKGTDNSFIGIVKEKLVDAGTGSDDNNLSKLEGYKARQDVAAGDIAIIEDYINDPVSMAKSLVPEIDINLIYQSLTSVQALATVRIIDVQVTMAQWVLSKLIPPRGFKFLNKISILNTLAVTQAVLWHKGHYELAALTTAASIDSEGEMQYYGVESRAKVSKELIERLDSLFPYSRKTSKKVERKNPALDAIESVGKQFSQYEWRLTLPADWIPRVVQNPPAANVRYGVPRDIKVKLAELVLDVAQKQGV